MTEQIIKDKFCYVYSCDLDVNLQIKIGTLEGQRDRPDHERLIKDPLLRYSGCCQDGCADLYVECRVYNNNKPMSFPIHTSYKSFTTRWNWNEWLTLPVKYSELPQNAMLVFTIYDIYGPNGTIPVGGTAITVFGKHGTVRQGMHDLVIWSGVQGDGSQMTLTPGKSRNKDDKMSKISKLSKKHRNGHMAKVDWLDRLTFREIEQINDGEKKDKNCLYLMIEFPRVHVDGIEHTVVYFEKGADELIQLPKQDIIHIPDPELNLENIVEAKHHKLARSLRSDPTDRDLKPNAATRDQLNLIVGFSPTKILTSEEKDLVWKFRFYLSTQKKDPEFNAPPGIGGTKKYRPPVGDFFLTLSRGFTRRSAAVSTAVSPAGSTAGMQKTAGTTSGSTAVSTAGPASKNQALTKFLKSVNWKASQETKQALDLLRKWSPMDVEDALELLSPAFDHPAVRRYAVNRLRQADDEELQLYLLQLVQALKYENFEEIRSQYEKEKSTHNASYAMFAASPQHKKPSLSLTETPTDVIAEQKRLVDDAPVQETEVLNEALQDALLEDSTLSDISSNVTAPAAAAPETMDLASFLIWRACNNSRLANYLWWYLKVESEEHEGQIKDEQTQEMYHTVLKRFNLAMKNGIVEWKLMRSSLSAQQTFMDNLVQLVKMIAREGKDRRKKIEKLQATLSSESEKFNFSRFDAIPLPLDPEIRIKGIQPESATLFKSALMPSRLTFLTEGGREYVAIFKHGDDLRQDQLVLQIITLMDRLLRKENLDLKLTPYKVLATSSKHGFVQFIESIPIAEVLETHGSVLAYFRKLAPSENSPYGVSPELIDNYVKSCAGYCVITYLLGVGDRHLDNLLLCKSGKLFHIDFGYILGRDPKPLPPPMKLNKDIVEAMGGITSDHFSEFKKLCYTAFLHLRRSSNLILNLFSLMVDANVPDIALEPDKTVKKVQDKFRLDLTDEQAVHYLQSLIDLSLSATVDALMEQMHKFAQYWRK